jgi:hypothetical protein
MLMSLFDGNRHSAAQSENPAGRKCPGKRRIPSLDESVRHFIGENLF